MRSPGARRVLLASVILFGAPPPAPAQETAPAELTCPNLLGEGVTTGRSFCDVLTALDPAEGVIVTLPPHRGRLQLTFDLHNRQTYSEQEVAAGRGFRRYTATIGVLTMDNTLLARAVIHSEFRGPSDLFDRVSADTGGRGLKAVAPTGVEPITVTIPADVDQVSLLGEKLEVERVGGRDFFTAPGRPVATISNVTVQYRPRGR